jgi:magnesium transporter
MKRLVKQPVDLARLGIKQVIQFVQKPIRRGPAGEAPGSLRVDPDAPIPVIKVMGYSDDECVEYQVKDVASLGEVLKPWPRKWIDVDGLGSEEIVRGIGDHFGLHPLALEDTVHVHQRAKSEDYGEYVYFVCRMVTLEEGKFVIEQVSLFIFPDLVLSFQERPGDCLEPVRERLRKSKGKIRFQSADYLAYAIIDALIDGYFPVLEKVGDDLEDLEELILENPTERLLQQVHQTKRELLTLRRAIWPIREAVNALMREDLQAISPDTRVFLRDCYDHSIQLVDLVENYRELASGLMDLYMTGVSNRMNEVMKILTIFATIFMPLGFIAGLYGMNFNTQSPYNMPELSWMYGYPFALALMLFTAVGLIMYFRRKQWI